MAYCKNCHQYFGLREKFLDHLDSEMKCIANECERKFAVKQSKEKISQQQLLSSSPINNFATKMSPVFTRKRINETKVLDPSWLPTSQKFEDKNYQKTIQKGLNYQQSFEDDFDMFPILPESIKQDYRPTGLETIAPRLPNLDHLPKPAPVQTLPYPIHQQPFGWTQPQQQLVKSEPAWDPGYIKNYQTPMTIQPSQIKQEPFCPYPIAPMQYQSPSTDIWTQHQQVFQQMPLPQRQEQKVGWQLPTTCTQEHSVLAFGFQADLTDNKFKSKFGMAYAKEKKSVFSKIGHGLKKINPEKVLSAVNGIVNYANQ